MRKFRSKEVPQANDITRVIEIIYAIDRLDIGTSLVKPRYINIAYDLVKNKSPFLKKNLLNNTDSDNIAISSSLKRDVAYYKDAADILGLSKSANNQLFQRFFLFFYCFPCMS